MAIKKSALYSSIWQGCDELRGGMDASQYKDYVLVLLFMKYVSDKKDKVVEIPQGCGFQDMVNLKGHPEIGDKINKLISDFAKANGLDGIITVADFNDDDKLGKGKDKVARLTNLIAIFENSALDFSENRAEHDDLLGDAYEYLMRHFATQSGKSKGQFYTPSEVSRVMAQVISIEQSKSQAETLYDPTCGSGSLLLKAADEAPHGISIYGQEKDNATRALSVMNMWLHSNPFADIRQGNTLADPEFKETGKLKRFDYAVANPPFSDKAWTNGVDVEHDQFKRFEGYTVPPAKNGDYAFLLHMLKSLKSTGKAAIILPLGVLFRGNAEAVIRKKIIQHGYIKGIIGLPANLFYGTGIAACILVLNKENAGQRKGIFLIDASKGYIKDGNKNRLRARDIHKIVDVFNNRVELPGYSRMVPTAEIAAAKNEYNLNIPRYIDAQETEDIQDINAHLSGGIPDRDIEALQNYWAVYPTLKNNLFRASRPGYWELHISREQIKAVIFEHPEFTAYSAKLNVVFTAWQSKNAAWLKDLNKGCLPKAIIKELAEDILQAYQDRELVNSYAVYQHVMDYWAETMQDDLYEIAADGWEAGKVLVRLTKKVKKKGKKKEEDKAIPGLAGLEGRLLPPELIIQEYFAEEQATIDALQSGLDSATAKMEALREEHNGEDGLLVEAMSDGQKITKAGLNARIKELGKKNADNAEEWAMLAQYKKLMAEETTAKAAIKKALADLEDKVILQYPKLTIEEIKTLTVKKKWLAAVESRIQTELEAISHRLTERIKELAERYATPLPELVDNVVALAANVEGHLERMGYRWKK
ncbi:MAG: type I restriction-modification system subunit M [Candidatus Electrothrix communis]|nr:MAG: type I restriction-modification system subunit M [Candidatus Electrothrix communis]